MEDLMKTLKETKELTLALATSSEEGGLKAWDEFELLPMPVLVSHAIAMRQAGIRSKDKGRLRRRLKATLRAQGVERQQLILENFAADLIDRCIGPSCVEVAFRFLMEAAEGLTDTTDGWHVRLPALLEQAYAEGILSLDDEIRDDEDPCLGFLLRSTLEGLSAKIFRKTLGTAIKLYSFGERETRAFALLEEAFCAFKLDWPWKQLEFVFRGIDGLPADNSSSLSEQDSFQSRIHNFPLDSGLRTQLNQSLPRTVRKVFEGLTEKVAARALAGLSEVEAREVLDLLPRSRVTNILRHFRWIYPPEEIRKIIRAQTNVSKQLRGF